MTTTLGRVRAPELRGAGGWINTERPLALRDLRGRVVVLDFWTFCCINCLRVVEELRPLEERFGDRLVVIGVHSPKFPHESDHDCGGAGRRAPPHRASCARRPRTRNLAAVRRARLADPRGDRPGRLRRCDGFRRGQRRGARRRDRSSSSKAGPISAAGPAFTPVRLAGSEARSHSPARSPRTAGAGSRSRTPATIASSSATSMGPSDQEFGGFHQPQGVRFDGDRLLVCDTVAGRGGRDRACPAASAGPRVGAALAVGRAGAPGRTHRRRRGGTAQDRRGPAAGGAPEVLAGSRAEGSA